MRAVLVSLLAVILLSLLGPGPASPAPPDDIATYCRTQHAQTPLQLRCISLENAAAARLARIGPGPDPEGWNRCRATVPSWSAMEQCLAAARAAAAAGGGGATGEASAGGSTPGAPGPAERPAGAAQPDAAEALPTPTAPPLDTTPPAPATPPSGVVPGSSTVILGPQPTPPWPAERNRTTRAISEADADRLLRDVQERHPSARCTKKQYGPGWVISCE